jgi:hypothetical protein
MLQMRMKKQLWVGYNLGKGDESIQKQAMVWNPLRTKAGRPKQT